MTKKEAPKNFSGTLATPLKYRGDGDFSTGLMDLYFALPSPISNRFRHKVHEEIDAACFDYEKERRAKFPALFAHYGIKMNAQNSWYKLARSLAIAHVLGFQIKKRKTSKSHHPHSDFELWAKVRLIKIESDHKYSQACENLWKRTGKKGKAGTIRRRFYAAEKVFAPVFSTIDDDMLKGVLSRALGKLTKKPRREIVER